ncbi:MAG: hypothetical protein LPK45_09300, partial [Bacteroidota bacterium]|nr:hypothetical protein [Bacteroidota bacterium]MDX5470019.1 hypothetical protein [Bacteroidota bacterium]
MKKLLALCLSLALFTGIVHAQNYDFNDIKRASTNGIQAIKNGNEVVGYISVIYLDNVSKKEKLYGLTILDINLQKTHYQEIVISKKEYLVGQAFNQKSFCFAFYDHKKKVINYRIYDLKLQEIGLLTCKDFHPSLVQNVASRPDDDKLNMAGLYAVPNQGFIRHGYEKNKGYKASIQMFDNSGEILWSSNTGTKGKMYEGAETYHIDEKVVLSTIMSKKSAFSSETRSYIICHSISSGEELYRIESDDNKYQMFAYDIYMNGDKNEFIACGEYYKTGQNILKVKSQGFFIQVYDANDGKLKKTSLVNWSKDVAKLLPTKAKSGYKDMDVSIHKMLVTADGKVYAIGEQFKKSVNAVGVASQVLTSNSNVSTVQVEIHDMMVFEFDSDLKLDKVEVYDKNTSKIWLPKGYGLLRGYLLANLLKLEGDFDHCYTSITPDRNNFNSVYVDYDRINMLKGKYMIGIIGLN